MDSRFGLHRDPISAPPASAPFVRAGIVALVVAAAWWAMAAPSPMPPTWPVGPQPVYSSLDPPALVALEPVLHAAWLGTPAPALAWFAAVVVILGASGVALFSGASTLAALFVLVALVSDAAFSSALTHAAGLSLAVGFVWLAAGAAFDDRSRLSGRRWINPLSALLLWGVAVWCHWVAVVAWPIVLAAFRRTPHRPVRGWWTVASIVVGVIAVVSHFASVAHETKILTTAAGAFGWRDAMWVAFDARPRMPLGSYAAPDLTTRLGYVVMALAGVGLLFGSLGRWWRRSVLLTAALAMGVGLTWSQWQAEVTRFALWSLAPLSAVGLTWVASQGRRPAAVTILLGAIGVSETMVLGARPLSGGEARQFRDVLLTTLEPRAQAGALALVAENTLIDSGLVPWIAGRVPNVVRLTQDGGAVAEARKMGRLVLAGPVGRRHLELSGVAFSDARPLSDLAPFTLFEAEGLFQCAVIRTDRWSQLPGLEYTGRLGIRVPPGIGGELDLIVGDALELPLRAESPDGSELAPRQDTLSSGPGVSPPPADFWIDDGAPSAEPRWIHRLRFAADPLVPSLVSLDLGRRAPRAIARLISYGEAARGRICAAPVGTMHLRVPGREILNLRDEALFGAGWYGLEARESGGYRWAGSDAVMLVRAPQRTDVEVTLEAGVAAETGPSGATTIALRVNGVEVGTRAASVEPRYTWQVPAGVWVAGTNELWWTTSRAVRPADAGGTDTRSLALRVTEVSLMRK
jgi:hypothetical protein